MSDTVAIIDYGAGNLRSVEKAFRRVADTLSLPLSVRITSQASVVAEVSHIVLPGQGAYADCRAGLDNVTGIVDALKEAVLDRGQPFFGICVGMQLLADRGLEHGETPGLGWIPGDVAALELAESQLKIPHMGWNNLTFHDMASGARHPVLDGVNDGDHAYFVHSYHFRCADKANLLAACDYGGPVTAVVGRDNMVGTQFHPEKSQQAGLRLIENFLRWRP